MTEPAFGSFALFVCILQQMQSEHIQSSMGICRDILPRVFLLVVLRSSCIYVRVCFVFSLCSFSKESLYILCRETHIQRL